MIFVISDLHLSFGSSKPMDIFNGWENYVPQLKENWNKTVSKNDTVVIVGDISWSMNLSEAKKDFEFINELQGQKIILKGNHDFWWSSTKKIQTFFQDNCFETIKILQNSAILLENKYVCGARGWKCKSENEHDIKIIKREAERLKLSLDSAKDKKLEKIVFMHFPPVYGNDSNELMNILIENKIKLCYYGHVHGRLAAKKAVVGNYKGVNLQFVSCDYLGFCPKAVTFTPS
ncbi:MAG: metallophosphoesterase [Oscillospiraceae bacterium]|jgi:predicted phosphohydrolase|nr:metallophosphoesterase [Oscillospiraceae bacterium]